MNLRTKNRCAFGAIIILAFYMALFLFGCASKDPTPKREMTPKDIVSGFYQTYNAQYVEYMTKTGYIQNIQGEWVKRFDPELTEDEKSILRAKKKVLEEVYPMIKVYDTYVVSGTPPDPALVTQITDKLAKLAVLLL